MAQNKKPMFDPDSALNSILGLGNTEHHGDGEAPLREEIEGLENNSYAHSYTDTHTDTDNRASEKPRKIISANYIEGRTKRANITLKPSVWEAAQKKCAKLNISVSDCVNQFLEEWIKEAD